MAQQGILIGVCEICGVQCSSRCSYCRLAYYCNSKHQKRDWKRHKPECTQQKFKFAENEALGRHLLATELLKSDQIVLKDVPIVIGPKVDPMTPQDGPGQRKTLFCLGCYRDLVEVDSEKPECVRCQLPICSEPCSENYWHKNFECRFFSEGMSCGSENIGNTIPEKDSVYNTVTVIQSLLYFRSFLLKIFFPEAFNRFSELQCNSALREDLASLEKTTRIFDDFKKLLEFVPHPSTTGGTGILKPELHRIIGIVDINGIDVQVATNTTLTGIYPTYAMMEHSCIPNTRVYFKPHQDSVDLYVRTVSRIEPGSHITSTYTNLLWNTEKRLEDLKKRKGFTCTCPRCTDPTELGTHFGTIKCPLAGCSGWSVPSVRTEPMSWECSQCSKTTEGWQVAKVDKRLAEMVSRLKPVLEPAYREMVQAMETLVHPNYYLNFVVNHSLIQLFCKDEPTRYDKPVLDEKIRICNQLLAVLKILDPGLGTLHLYAAVVHYEMQSAILALIGAEGENDFQILRAHPESVKLALIYLDRALKCFQYEYFPLQENKLRLLVEKKMEYLNMVVKHLKK